MCSPRRAIDRSGALAALGAIADALTGSGGAAGLLSSIAHDGRAATRISTRIDVTPPGLAVVSACSLPRSEPGT